LLSDSPHVLETAESLQAAAFRARRVARKAWNLGKRPAEKDHYVREFFRQSQEARERFIAAAREELGQPPRPQQIEPPPELDQLMQPLEVQELEEGPYEDSESQERG
jgi:hypothetical protein